jgi:hypothetical protein
VKDNGQPPILVSTLTPGTYSLAGEPRTVVCGECGTWHRVRKGMVWPHDNERGARCEWSGQLVWFDLDPQQEAAGRLALELDSRDAGQRRGNRAHPESGTAVLVPHAYLGRDRTPQWGQVAGWTLADQRTRDFEHANTAKRASDLLTHRSFETSPRTP